jgi:gamma-glutamyltranspeptidase/glutathione hydrolase
MAATSTDPRHVPARVIPRRRVSGNEGFRGTSSAIVALVAALLFGAAAGLAQDLPEEIRTVEVRSPNGVVVANTREAAAAGGRILQQGGNAVDAAVAAALALGVSEAEASGIGGSAWILIHLANGRDVAIDGSSGVPARVRPAEIQRQLDDGFEFGYRTVAAPGGLAALTYALQRYGTRSFEEVVAPAIEIADFGFQLAPHEIGVLGAFGWKLRSCPTLRDIFLMPSLEPWGSEHTFCMDALATTMRRLARNGPGDFYVGAIADEIDADMRGGGGFLRKSDLVTVRTVERAPYRGRYRGLDVVSFPDPGGGGAVIEALQILDNFPRHTVTAHSADAMVVLLEAARIALYDLYVAQASGPLEALRMLDAKWAARRAAQIRPERTLRVGEILEKDVIPPRLEGSTHLSVIDRNGNAVALSLTFNNEFGACVATPGLGFPYNAALAFYDLGSPRSRLYLTPGNVLPNTMAPTIVLRDGKPLLVLGGPGSARITSSIVGTIVNIVDRGLNPADAVSEPRLLWDGSRTPRVLIEMAGANTDGDVAELIRRGFVNIYTLCFPPRPIDLLAFGGVNIATLDASTGETVGVGDPRRTGVAAGGDAP